MGRRHTTTQVTATFHSGSQEHDVFEITYNTVELVTDNLVLQLTRYYACPYGQRNR